MNGKFTLFDAMPLFGLLSGSIIGFDVGFQTHVIVSGVIGAILGASLGLTSVVLFFVLVAVLCMTNDGLSRIVLLLRSTAALRRRAGENLHTSRRILAELVRRGEPIESLREVIREQLRSSSHTDRWVAERNAAQWCPDMLPCTSTSPVVFEPVWRTHTVVELAQAIEQEAAFDRLPILADALQDAGCDNADILNHCRQPGEHVRGCWVIDVLLGKE